MGDYGGEALILTHGSDPNQVALTLDDGPSPYWTMKILESLHKHSAKATFFVLGKWAQKYPELLRICAFNGHEIGNHTMNHQALGQLLPDQVEREIAEAQRIITTATGIPPKLFRPPYGNAPQAVEQILAPTGMRVVMWSQMSGDWAAESADEILSKINLDTGRGEIVLLHDGGPMDLGADRSHTVVAVERLLAAHPEKKFVTVSELTL